MSENLLVNIMWDMALWGLKFALYIWWAILIILLIAVLIWFLLARISNSRSKNKDYEDESNNISEKKTKKSVYKSKNLFENSELAFFKQLNDYLKNKELFILSKVRLADFICLKEYIPWFDYYKYRSKITEKHVDFLIVDNYWKIIVLLELDWKSHNTENTVKSDIFKNDVFKELELPFERFENSKTYYNFSKLDKYINK